MSDLLAQAQAAFRAGRVEQAEGLLRRVLEAAPEDGPANHLLGLIALHRRRYREAAGLFSRAIAARPRLARAHMNLGIAQSGLGDIRAAEGSYRRAIEINPELPVAVINLAGLLMQAGRLGEAIDVLRPAIKRMPDRFELHNNLGIALLRLGKAKEAVRALQRGLSVAPKLALAHANLGRALQAAGRREEAGARLRRALELSPDDARTLARLAGLEQEHGNLAEALRLALRARELDAKSFAATIVLFHCRLEQGRLDEAEAEARRALDLDPHSAEAGLALARALEEQGDPQAALDTVEAILARADDERDAAEHRQRLWLKLGRYDLAWSSSATTGTTRTVTTPPKWDGGPFPGKALFLRHSGSLEDSLQFLRYAPMALARGGKVLLQAPQQLRRLCADMDGIELTEGGKPPDEADLQAQLVDLPRLFGTTVETVPANVPYLTAPIRLVRLWEDRFAYFERPRIGLCWRPGIVARHDGRAIPLPFLAEAVQGRGASLVSLQRDAARRQISGVGGIFDPKEDPDYGATAFEDFADMAGMMANLDLVVSVDSTVAHLAGATGTPCILLLPFAADWRWLMEREDSPWYPSLTLLRQRRPGDWHEVAERLGGLLNARFGESG